jgi:integrase
MTDLLGSGSRYQIRGVLGEPPVRFHDLRHTCVSRLLDQGEPPHVVREIAGHSALEVTMTIYAHTSLSEKTSRAETTRNRLS